MNKSMENKTHFKMYKSGKNWVIAGIVSGCLALTFGGGVTAQASDQGEIATSETATTTPATDATVTLTTPATTDEAATSTAPAETPVSAGPTETVAADESAAAVTETPASVDTSATADDATVVSTGDVTTPAAPVVPETPVVTTPVADQTADTTGATSPAGERPVGEAEAPVTDAADTATTKPAFDETEVVTETPDTPVVPETPAVTTPDAPIVSETATTPETPEISVTPEVSATPEVPTTSATTVATTRPVDDQVIPVQSDVTHALGASHTEVAVPAVQAEMTKPATMKVTHAPTASTIDDWMPNKRLQQAVLLHLQRLTGVDKKWNSVADITQEDLQLLKKLMVLGNDGFDTYIDGHTAFSLEGLQYATNLETIMMEASLNHKPGAFYGDIVDVSPLANLQHLTTVHLQHNRIEDVTPLANLQNVTTMALAYNHIRDFSPLKGKPYKDFTYTGQFIMLDPLMVNDDDRKGHLQIQCVTITGEVVTLTTGMAIAEPVFYTTEAGHTYHIYYTGGNPKPDGQGGVYFTNIQDQKPGATNFPGAPNVDVLQDYYYLTGSYKPSAGVVDFAVVQPYVISHAANNVTVHYHDLDGNAIADDVVLAPGMVGEHYTTTAPEIPDYTLMVTPENANGTYGDAAIDVTYVYTQSESDSGDSDGNGENPDGGGNTENPGGGHPGENPDGGGNTENPGGGHPGENPDGDGNTENPGDGHPGETPGGSGEQPGTGNTDGNGSEGDGANPGTPGGNQPGTQPGTSQPEAPVEDDESTETGTEGDTAASETGTTGSGSTGAATTTTQATGGHPVQLTMNHEAATAASESTDGDQPVKVLASGLAPAALPQTDEQTTSPALGLALLAGLFGLFGFKLKRKR